MTKLYRNIIAAILVGIAAVATPSSYAQDLFSGDMPFHGQEHSYVAPGRFVATTFIDRLYNLTKKELSKFDDSKTVAYLRIPTTHLKNFESLGLPDPPFKNDKFSILIFFDKNYGAIQRATIANYVRMLAKYPSVKFNADLGLYESNFEGLGSYYLTSFDPRSLGMEDISGNELMLSCQRYQDSPAASATCDRTTIFDGMLVEFTISESNLGALQSYDTAIRDMLLDWRVPNTANGDVGK